MDLLADCCLQMIKLLDQLLEQGMITEEEHEKHVALKKKFLEDYPIKASE